MFSSLYLFLLHQLTLRLYSLCVTDANDMATGNTEVYFKVQILYTVNNCK